MRFHCIKVRYSIEHRDRIFVFCEKVISNKYGQKRLDSNKKFTRMQ